MRCPLTLGLLVLGGWLGATVPARAQILPDRTLGPESSQVVRDSSPGFANGDVPPAGLRQGLTEQFRLEGGAIRQGNLFHSFQEFNLGEGQGAYFANPSGVSNIFSRVTGSQPSRILGTLGVLGSANLFFLNPNGILFGPRARLDLRGSFVATSAEAVLFGDGVEFASSPPPGPPLLTVTLPVGLRFRETAGAIVNQSQAPALGGSVFPPELPFGSLVGLAVDPGQTLALLGGEIQVPGGYGTANSGQVVLASVGSGEVGISIEGRVNVGDAGMDRAGKITLSDQAQLNTSGPSGGRITLAGSQIDLNDAKLYAVTLGELAGGGILLTGDRLHIAGASQLSTLTVGAGPGGPLTLVARDSLNIEGIGFAGFQRIVGQYLLFGAFDPFDPQVTLVTSTAGLGSTGTLRLEADRLNLSQGAFLSTATNGPGPGGSLQLIAPQIDIFGAGMTSGTFRGSTGPGGPLTITADTFTLRDGSVIGSPALGEGNSGNIQIRAREAVNLLRTPAGAVVQTLIGTTAIGGPNGKAGNLTIDTQRLTIADGAGISLSSGAAIAGQILSVSGGPGGNLIIRASESVEIVGVSGVLANGNISTSFIAADTYTPNSGGNITILTPRLSLRGGGAISVASIGRGNAGNTTVVADRLEVSGDKSILQASVGLSGGITNPTATANAGSLNLTLGQLLVSEGGTINVASLGSGQAGNINISAGNITLDQQGSIDGSTGSGAGANLNLSADTLILRRGSRIATDAGTSDGGNITLNGQLLVGLGQENSDITANARTAQGGKVTVNVANILGFRPLTREQARQALGLDNTAFAALEVNPTRLIPTNDIAAISQTSGPALQGTVSFRASGVNPAQGLVELPQAVVDPQGLVTANPCEASQGSTFTVLGRGGVPPQPGDVLTASSTVSPWVEPTGGVVVSLLAASVQTPGQTPATAYPALPAPPAQGWVTHSPGQVTLVGDSGASLSPLGRSFPIAASCIRPQP